MNTLTRTLRLFVAFFVAAALPLTVVAQDGIQYHRPSGQAGINTFETPTDPGEEYDGFAVDWGAAFTQQFQGLSHSSDGTELDEIAGGFNLATANLDLNAQLAPGARVRVRTYLSSRHHPEAWVKGGYLQFDELPMFNSAAIDGLMENLTVRVGHFEVNYGDAHFRRTDNGDALHNPFVGNNVLDAFNTEIGGEVYVRSNGFLAMGAMTGGEINGGVTNPGDRTPSFYGKLGIDRELNSDLRVRLTGSGYYTKKSIANHLHSGDRAGSRYYSVVGGGDWSGRLRTDFGNQVTAFVVNPFVRFQGLELFGTIETVSGDGADTNGLFEGTVNQYAAEAVYRFSDDDLFVGLRYNTVEGDFDEGGYQQPPNWVESASVDRWQIGAGWFMTDKVLMKAEYVTQSYDGFAAGTPREGAEFHGVMIEGIVSF